MINRVWIVSELYYPEDTSTGYFLTRIAEELAYDFPVHVLCSQPTYSARGVRAPFREQRNGVNIQRCRATTLNKDNLLFRLVNLVTISLAIFVSAVFQINRRDCVIVVTNPPLLPFVVATACWLRGVPCLLCIHDVYPEVLTAVGMMQSEASWTGLIRWFTRLLYGSMKRIIVLGRDMKRVVAQKLGQTYTPIVIIPNWGDIDQIVPSQRNHNALLHELGLTNKFVVQYAGNMGRTHGLESLLESARKLSEKSKIHFLFAGWGAKKRWLEETVQKECLHNVTILANRPRDDLHNLLNACDVAIISFVPGMAGVSVPSRMYNIMAAGKPIIAVADSDSELALVVQEEQIGWIVPPDQPDRITEAILEAQAHPDWLAKMGLRARQAAEEKYSLPLVIEAYRTLIHSLEDVPK
jgi:glycosyltransferase involved in cell wall biosynthesis